MLVTITEFAKMAGVSRNTVYDGIKKGRIVAQGSNVDDEEPTNKEYLRRKTGSGIPEGGDESPAMIRAKLEVQKLEQQVIQLQLKNATETKQVLTRSFVERRFVAPVISELTRMITDAPGSMASTLQAMFAAGDTREEIESKIEAMLCKYIESIKQKLTVAEKDA